MPFKKSHSGDKVGKMNNPSEEIPQTFFMKVSLGIPTLYVLETLLS